jgi:isopenicillin-N epimerase
MAPKSAAFLYARREYQDLLEPLVVSWGWESRKPYRPNFLEYFEWRGTHDPAAYLAVPAAIDFQASYNWPAVRAACHELASQARARISELTGVPPVHDESTTWWSQMTLLSLPSDCDHSELKARLWDEYKVEIPETSWGDRKFLRLSVQSYTSQEHIDRLVTGVRNILELG